MEGRQKGDMALFPRKRKLELTPNHEKIIKRQRRVDKQRSACSVPTDITQVTTLKAAGVPENIKVRQIFEHVYEKVVTLKDWVTCLELEGLSILQEEDSQGYVNLLYKTIVAEPVTRKVLPPTSLSQASHQREIILRVVQKLKTKNVNNVLCLGFETISDNPNAHLLDAMPSLEYHTPNSAFNRLQFSPWKTLLSRIGDELMMRLLERASVYCHVPPSNYVQLTGIPIYELLPQASVTMARTPVLKKTSLGKRKGSIEVEKLAKKRKTKDLINIEVEKIRKRGNGRKKQAKSFNFTKASEENRLTSKKPFKFDRLLSQQSFMYSRCLREQIPSSFCLGFSSEMITKLILERTEQRPNKREIQTQLHEKCVWQHQNVNQQTQEKQQFHQLSNQNVQMTQHTPASESSPLCSSSQDIGLGFRLQALCNRMIKKHKKCRYKSMLNYYCGTTPTVWTKGHEVKLIPVFTRGAPATVYLSKKQTKLKKFHPTLGQLLDRTVPRRQVFLFLRALCFWLIPIEMFGSEGNRKIFFKNVEKIVGLGLHDKFSLRQVVMNIKVTSFEYLCSGMPHLDSVRVVAQVHWWLFTSIVFPLIKSFFYVTETNLHRNRLVYYRKTVWSQLHQRCLAAHLKKRMLCPVSKSEVDDLLDKDKTLGISNLRFLPKLNSLRPVVNMGRKPEQWTKRQKLSINSQLKTVLSILQYHVQNNPTLLGSGKFGFDDILEAYHRFVVTRRTCEDVRPLYFVKTDISKCFDMILQDKLYKIIERIIKSEEEYITRRSGSVLVCGNRIRKIFHKQTFTLADYEPDFVRFVKKKVLREGLKNRVFVDQVIHPQPLVQHVLTILKNHIFNNIIKIGKRFYRQTIGISQGSVLSTMLCSLYTAHMEQEIVTPPPRDDELMMRLVDDNLFITPYRDRAVCFLHTALTGCIHYNLHSNMEKVLTNFNYSHPDLGPVPVICKTDAFPWCGMLIDQHVLSVSVDYSRYAGQAVKDTLTMDFSSQPGIALKNRMLLTLKSRCHSIYLDPQINTLGARIQNVFKAFILTAYKLHCFVQTVWPHRQKKNHIFLKKVILTLAHFVTYKQDVILKGSQVRSATAVCPLSLPLIHWLCVQAHILKLQEHHSMYSQLLTLLMRYRTGFYRRMSVQDQSEVDTIKTIPDVFRELL